MSLINITSPQASSGKTTLAINLATSLSLRGYRVLLIYKLDKNITIWLDNIFNSTYNFDILSISNPEELQAINYVDFDYIIVDLNISKIASLIPTHQVLDIICLDFTKLDLDYLTAIIPDIKAHTYILPCKVKFKAWQTVELLDFLANHLNYEYILDGIGY